MKIQNKASVTRFSVPGCAETSVVVYYHKIKKCYSAVFFTFNCELEVRVEAIDFTQLFSDVVFVDGTYNVVNISLKDLS